jgi:hypothetical protein
VQAVRVELEIGEFELVGHPKHILDTFAPTTTEYVPTPQSMHDTLSLKVLYFPATQFVHVPPDSPKEPALQVQAASTVLETGEPEFSGHDVHDAFPVIYLYLPDSHATQFGPVKPA